MPRSRAVAIDCRRDISASDLAFRVVAGRDCILAIIALKSKKATPQEMAELAEGIVNGTSGAWDVDDYEHWNPKDAEARTLWNRTMTLGGLPEEWVRLDEAQKNELRSIISTLRQLGNERG